MGLIADIVESAVKALAGVATGFRWNPVAVSEDLPKLAELFKDKTEEFAGEHPTLVAFGALSNLPALVTFTALGLGDPKSFAAELLRKFSEILNDAFGLLNVEVQQIAPGSPIALADQIHVLLEQGRVGAQERVTSAISLINFIVGTGSAISVAVEVLSLGQVDTIADAIQSWVWANGIGSFSPLAFAPQINASVNPYLSRYYNSRAQAQIPPVTDIIRFQLREVFLEGRREELVGREDRPIYNALMQQWGFNEFHADSYWGAHWVLPSIGQLNEMLFRGVIDKPEWERFVRFNDVEPLSIPRLGEIIYNPYTRVDTRRMADLGVLNEQEQLQAYADLGFFAPTQVDATGRFRAVFRPNPDFTVDKAQALVVFTRLFNALPDLRSRFRNGWLSSDELLDELLATGIPPDRAQVQWETIVKAEKELRVAPEKELTRGLVARAWKLRMVSFPQAVFLLTRMGWDEAEAELILRVQSLPDDPLAFVNTNLGFRLGSGIPLRPASEEGLVEI